MEGVHVCLLASDFLSLRAVPEQPGSFVRNGRLVRKVEMVGLLVALERRERYVRFTLDDGSGCVECVLWMSAGREQAYSSRSVELALQSQIALILSQRVRFGRLLRVQGRVTSFRGQTQITVVSIQEETDPNSEVYQWMRCIDLALNCYDKHLPAQTMGGGAESGGGGVPSGGEASFGLFQLRTSLA